MAFNYDQNYGRVARLYPTAEHGGRVYFRLKDGQTAMNPKAGYYFRVMTSDENDSPYQQDPDGDGKNYTNADNYAFCAFPAEYKKSGYNTFIINKEKVLYQKDTMGKPVTRWPDKDPTQSGWKIIDD